MVFMILFFIALMVIGVMAYKWPKVVEISDELPEKINKRSLWLKLQNEGKNYVRTDEKRVYLKVVK